MCDGTYVSRVLVKKSLEMINESVKEKRALEKGEDTEEFIYTLICTGIITHCSRTAGFSLQYKEHTHTNNIMF